MLVPVGDKYWIHPLAIRVVFFATQMSGRHFNWWGTIMVFVKKTCRKLVGFELSHPVKHSLCRITQLAQGRFRVGPKSSMLVSHWPMLGDVWDLWAFSLLNVSNASGQELNLFIHGVHLTRFVSNRSFVLRSIFCTASALISLYFVSSYFPVLYVDEKWMARWR